MNSAPLWFYTKPEGHPITPWHSAKPEYRTLNYTLQQPQKLQGQLMNTNKPNSEGSILTVQQRSRTPPTDTIQWLGYLKQYEDNFILHHKQKHTIF